jgi:hypothetical protein
MEDLAKAFQMLNQSVNGLVLQKSLNAANEQVNQIRSSELKEEEKRGQLRGLANDLTMRLTGMGMDPQSIAQATNAIAPKPLFNTPEQALMYGDENESAKAQEIIDAEQKRKMSLVGAQSQGRSMKDASKTMLALQKDFGRVKVKMTGASQAIRSAIKSIKAGNPMAKESVATALARASGEVGNLTPQERAAFYGSQAVLDELSQYVATKWDSSQTEKNQKALMGLIDIYDSTLNESVNALGGMYANQLGEHSGFQGMDRGILLRKISGGTLDPAVVFKDNSAYPGSAPQRGGSASFDAPPAKGGKNDLGFDPEFFEK